MSETPSSETGSAARWQPLDRIQRRVVGVLVEKAKTTPENYPLSINSLVNGCNQKSNRFPQMQLEEPQVDEALEQLCAMGAVSLIQGDGRVDKHRHLLYEWLAVSKVELAVMAELLLRGAQSIGELRGRAARMEPIKDIGELRPIVDSLQQKGLLILLTPPGRGCVVTHALYHEQELVKLRAEHGNESNDEPATGVSSPQAKSIQRPAGDNQVQSLRAEVVSLKEQIADMRTQFEDALAKLRSELEELNRQLGN